MTDAKTAWDDVADRLEGLGQQLRARLEEAAGTPAQRRELQTSLQRSLQDLGGALERAVRAVDEAVGDSGVRQQAAALGRAVSDALSATFSEASQRLRGLDNKIAELGKARGEDTGSSSV